MNTLKIKSAIEKGVEMCDVALPQFNWGRSALGADAIRLLNEAPGELRAALEEVAQITQAEADVLAERRRQQKVEGFTSDWDDAYTTRAMSVAAACYIHYADSYPAGSKPPHWPWDTIWWKPSPDPRRNMIKAAALILADLDRLDRKQACLSTPA